MIPIPKKVLKEITEGFVDLASSDGIYEILEDAAAEKGFTEESKEFDKLVDSWVDWVEKKAKGIFKK